MASRFRRVLVARYSLRWHMGLILTGVVTSAILANGILRAFGLRSMPMRYGLALTLAYATFFLLVWVWLQFVSRRRGESSDSDDSSSDVSIDGWGAGRSRESRSSWSRPTGGGGRSGGGGASASFGEAPAEPEPARSSPAASRLVGFFGRKSGSRDSSGSDDGDSGGSGKGGPLGALGALLVVILPLVVIAAVCAYLVSNGPEVLGEIAFQAILARALLGRAVGPRSGTWLEAAFRRTMLPFAIVLGVVLVGGGYAQHRCPRAATLVEVLRFCGF